MEINKIPLLPDPRVVEGYQKDDGVYLSVKIGNGQSGGTKVTWNGKVLAKGDLEEPAFLGDAGELKTRPIEVETNVLDVNPYTNRCVITTRFLDEDEQEKKMYRDKGNAPEGGLASFNGNYQLKLLTVILFIMFAWTQQPLAAQSFSEAIEFEELSTPASPGFILLDETPSSIERPSTPQGLGFSLLGLGKDGGALECAPFWLIDHPDLTASDIYNKRMPLTMHASISVASVVDDTASFLAFGIRTRLFQSYGKNAAMLDAYSDSISIAAADLDLDRLEALRDSYTGIFSKPILSIDFAAAVGGGTQSNSFSDLELQRWAAWLTFNYRPGGDNFYMTVLTRYINNEEYRVYDDQINLVDLGARLNYDIAKVTLSLEYLQRLNITESIYDDYRLAIVGNYKVAENIYITATFGKNFTELNNLIALAGVDIGFSNNKLKAY